MTERGDREDRVVVDASAIFTLVSDSTGLGDAVAKAIGGRRIFVPSLAEYEVAKRDSPLSEGRQDDEA